MQKEIVRQVKQYEAKNPDLIVFGELSISGYSCGDLFLSQLWMNSAEWQSRIYVIFCRSQIHLLQLGPLKKDAV